MPPTDIAELRRLHEAATTGKWFAFRLSVASTSVLVGNIVCQPPDEDCEESLKQWPHNADYISAVRNALPALLDELEELREEVAALRQERDAAVYVIQINGHATDNASKLLDARDRRMKLIGAAEWLEANNERLDTMNRADVEEVAAQLRREAEEK